MKRRYTSSTTYEAPQFRWVLMVDMYAAASEATTRPRSPWGRKISMAGYARSLRTMEGSRWGNAAWMDASVG